MPRGRRKAQARRWYAAGTAAGLGAIVGAAVLMLPHRPAPPSQTVADSCGLVRCQASLPAPGGVDASTAAARRSHARSHASPAASRRRRRPSPGPGASSPTPRASASVSPVPAPSGPPPPDVTVTYVLQQAHHGPHSPFQGLLTVTNLGHAAVRGWRLKLSFPGDSIEEVGPPGGTPFDIWTYNGATLELTAADSAETLRPRGAEQILITGHGPTSSPAGCTFDGSACVP